MKNQKTIAIVGLVAVVMTAAWMYKSERKQKNKGYANITGKGTTQNCAKCRDENGNVYGTDNSRNCNGNDVCLSRYSYPRETSSET